MSEAGSTADSRDLPLPRLLLGVKQTQSARKRTWGSNVAVRGKADVVCQGLSGPLIARSGNHSLEFRRLCLLGIYRLNARLHFFCISLSALMLIQRCQELQYSNCSVPNHIWIVLPHARNERII